MPAIGRSKVRVWATVMGVAWALALLTLSYSASAQEPQQLCEWLKSVYINSGDPQVPGDGPFGVVVSDTVVIEDYLLCSESGFFEWNLLESWGQPPLSLEGAEAWPAGYVDLGPGWFNWFYPFPPGWDLFMYPAWLMKVFQVYEPGWVQTSMLETVQFTLGGTPVGEGEMTVDLVEMVEGGDAPSSFNHAGLGMSAYPPGPGAPPGAVTANFPVVWGSVPVLLSPSVWGFCHYSQFSPSYLGAGLTYEFDADLLPDQDPTTNIDPWMGAFGPADTPDLDLSDDGVTFPSVLPHCGTATVHVTGFNGSGGDLFINGWADWNRDGDWNDGSVCGCGDDEWAIQDYAVAAGSFDEYIPITPCHPGGDPTEPLWARVTLSEGPELGVRPEPEWQVGGQPYPAWDPEPLAPQGCFLQGETEDYYIDELEPPECWWDKDVYINGEGPFPPEPERFPVVISDTITISETLWCNFEYDWDLWDWWGGEDDMALREPVVPQVVPVSPLSLVDFDFGAPPGTDVYTDTDGLSYLHWWGGLTEFVRPGLPITMTKTLRVDAPGWVAWEIWEAVWFSPLDIHMDQLVDLWEMAEGGDAPSRHNHGLWPAQPNQPMTTYLGGPLANFPVVWDFDGALGPSPVTGYYGFCHWSSPSPSFIGAPPSYELDADLTPDQDGKPNIDPPVDTPNWDADGGVIFPGVLPHCGPATVDVWVQNNHIEVLYLNGWADWNRDGDWEDTGLCECGIDEWTIKDLPVPVGFSGPMQVQITPCHPGDPYEELWARVTLSEIPMGPGGPPYIFGGQPYPAWDPEPLAPQGCFLQGETEDYFVEMFDVCWWEKEVSIDGNGPFVPEEGPFTVVVSNTVNITDAFTCSFPYDWHLLEHWDSDGLSLQGYRVEAPSGTDWSETGDLGVLELAGGLSVPVNPGDQVVITKTLHVDALPDLTTQVITETLDFTKIGAPPVYTWDRPVLLKPYQVYVPLVMKNY